MTENEVWKKITFDNYETIYNVSNLGRIYNRDTARILKPVPDKRKGYLMVYLRLGKEHYARCRVHRLVAQYFIENPDPKNKTQVNHKDGDKTNNAASNLEWVSPKENVNHAFSTGLHPVYTCEKASHAKLTNEEVELICQFMMKFPEISLKKVARMFEVGYSTIQNIRLHRQWVEISSKYDFPMIHDTNRSKKVNKEIDMMLLSGYGMKYVIKHIKWPKGFTDKAKYNTVYYRKSKLKDKQRSTTIQMVPLESATGVGLK